MHEHAMVIGRRIRQAREAVNLSQLDLAQKVGLKTQGAISTYERGIREPPRETLEAIALVTDRPVSWFLGAGGKRVEPWEEICDRALAADSSAGLFEALGKRDFMAWTRLRAIVGEVFGLDLEEVQDQMRGDQDLLKPRELFRAFEQLKDADAPQHRIIMDFTILVEVRRVRSLLDPGQGRDSPLRPTDSMGTDSSTEEEDY